jgi:hypothetical protein
MPDATTHALRTAASASIVSLLSTLTVPAVAETGRFHHCPPGAGILTTADFRLGGPAVSGT